MNARVEPPHLRAIHRAWLHINHTRADVQKISSWSERDQYFPKDRKRGTRRRTYHSLPSSVPALLTWYQGGKKKRVKEQGTIGDRRAWKPTVPHERLKVKLRSTTAREFGFPLVTEYSQSYPTLPAASAALTLKYDLILPLRTSSKRGKRFRDVPLKSGRPNGYLRARCWPSGLRRADTERHVRNNFRYTSIPVFPSTIAHDSRIKSNDPWL